MQQTLPTTTTSNPDKSTNSPQKFLDWHIALAKIKSIIDRFPGVARGEFLPSLAWYAVLVAGHRALSHLNDEHLNCGVLWDPETGFPSHPSFIADAQHYAQPADINPRSKALVQSFKEWASFAKETLQCCCGGNSLTLRPVEMELMINHSVKREENMLRITQRVGVRSNDMKHLRNHYSDFSKQSVRDENLYIIWTASNKIVYREEDGLRVIPIESVSAKEFGPGALCDELVRLVEKDFNFAG